MMRTTQDWLIFSAIMLTFVAAMVLAGYLYLDNCKLRTERSNMKEYVNRLLSTQAEMRLSEARRKTWLDRAPAEVSEAKPALDKTEIIAPSAKVYVSKPAEGEEVIELQKPISPENADLLKNLHTALFNTGSENKIVNNSSLNNTKGGRHRGEG